MPQYLFEPNTWFPVRWEPPFADGQNTITNLLVVYRHGKNLQYSLATAERHFDGNGQTTGYRFFSQKFGHSSPILRGDEKLRDTFRTPVGWMKPVPPEWALE